MKKGCTNDQPGHYGHKNSTRCIAGEPWTSKIGYENPDCHDYNPTRWNMGNHFLQEHPDHPKTIELRRDILGWDQPPEEPAQPRTPLRRHIAGKDPWDE